LEHARNDAALDVLKELGFEIGESLTVDEDARVRISNARAKVFRASGMSFWKARKFIANSYRSFASWFADGVTPSLNACGLDCSPLPAVSSPLFDRWSVKQFTGIALKSFPVGGNMKFLPIRLIFALCAVAALAQEAALPNAVVIKMVQNGVPTDTQPDPIRARLRTNQSYLSARRMRLPRPV
jgi:hypothetical protein